MSFRWRRAALWAVLASFFLLACVPVTIGGGSHSRRRSSNIQRSGKQAVKMVAAGALFLLGPDLVFRRDGVDGKAAVRGGWPFVVVYELEQPGHLLLTITPKSGAATSYPIPAVGIAPAGSRQESDKFYLSKDLGDAIQEGNLSLRAYAGEDGEQPVPFKIYGLGAGDEAVGSMTVVNIRFSPSEIEAKHGQPAKYSFEVRRSFNKARVEVNRLDDSTGAPTRIFWEDVKPTPSEGHVSSGFWDGRDLKNHRVSEGNHILQVSAWFGPDKGDWNAALSETLVRVRP